jgi:DNA-binding NtrC family response regulator
MKNKKLEIVIIEDEEDILELLEYHLQKIDYSTIGFLSTDGVEQFLFWRKRHFVLIRVIFSTFIEPTQELLPLIVISYPITVI